jgi:hypothetical protein
VRRRLVFTSVLGLLAATGLALTWRVAGQSEWAYDAASYLLLGLALVGAFDVWLPRGDYSEMGGALVFAAGMLLNPLLGAMIILAARVIVWATRRFRENPWRVIEDMTRRVMLMSWSALFFVLLGGSMPVVTAKGAPFFGRALLAALFYLAMDMAITQLSASIRLGTPYLPLLLGNVRLQGLVGVAQVSAAVLAVLTYGTMGALGLVIVVGLLLVMRQSFSLLVEVRQAYRSTVEALARAIEAQDPRRRGHAERVAALATEAGRLLGQHGKELEALTYAALFHDVGRLDSEDAASAKGGSEVLASVGFLAHSVPILRIIDVRGEVESSQSEQDLVAAYIIARMSAYDESDQGLSDGNGVDVGGAIGARLYSDTRRTVDRSIGRVERRAERGRLPKTRAALEEAW